MNLDIYNLSRAFINMFRIELKKDGQKLIFDQLKPVFDQYEKLESISWNQWTPGFCDGDPCHFRTTTYDPYIQLNSEIDEKEEIEIYRKVSEILKFFVDEDYEIIYGDGYTITISRNGTDIKEYYE